MKTLREKTVAKIDALKARLEAMDKREATAIRKRDTRRKIILGGALLDMAKTDAGAQKMVKTIISDLSRPHDIKAFEGWGEKKD